MRSGDSSEISNLCIHPKLCRLYTVFRRVNGLTILSGLLPLHHNSLSSKIFGIRDDHWELKFREVHIPHARLDRILDTLYLLLMLKHAFVQVDRMDHSWIFLSLQKQRVNQGVHNIIHFCHTHCWEHVLSPILLDVLVSVSPLIFHSCSSFPYKLLWFLKFPVSLSINVIDVIFRHRHIHCNFDVFALLWNCHFNLMFILILNYAPCGIQW